MHHWNAFSLQVTKIRAQRYDSGDWQFPTASHCFPIMHNKSHCVPFRVRQKEDIAACGDVG